MRDQRSSNGENITTRSDRIAHLAMSRLPCSHDKRRDNFDFPHYVWTKVRGKVTGTSTVVHELGHGLGLVHRFNSTNSVMSYALGRSSNFSQSEIDALIGAYR